MSVSSRVIRASPRHLTRVCYLTGARNGVPPRCRLSSSTPDPSHQLSTYSTTSSVSNNTSSSFHSSSPSSSAHHSLSTFLSYAASTSLSPTSTVFTGTRYEYLAQDSLRLLGFDLVRSGGRSDGGIDLYGTWTLPSEDAPPPLRCIVQCKALAKKAGPNLVRELEGAFPAARIGWQADATVGVLVATREASKGVREAIRRSRRGIVWVMLQDAGGARTDAVIRQILWNERVAELGATGVGVGAVYGAPDGHGEVESEARLVWKGKVWEPVIEAKTEGETEPKEIEVAAV